MRYKAASKTLQLTVYNLLVMVLVVPIYTIKYTLEPWEDRLQKTLLYSLEVALRVRDYSVEVIFKGENNWHNVWYCNYLPNREKKDITTRVRLRQHKGLWFLNDALGNIVKQNILTSYCKDMFQQNRHIEGHMIQTETTWYWLDLQHIFFLRYY